MAINIGSTEMGSIYLGSTEIGEVYLGNVKLYGQAPLVLPQRTFRCKYNPGTQPMSPGSFESATLIDATNNIWDLVGASWGVSGFQNDLNLLEIVGANPTGFPYNGIGNQTFINCTSLTKVAALDLSNVSVWDGMNKTFAGCSNLTKISFYNTSTVTRFVRTFENCTSLVQVPLFDTSNVTNCDYAFSNCYNVESGALALYTQMSTQTNVPSSHSNCFTNCGRDTVTGAAELAQIPSSWGGTGA